MRAGFGGAADNGLATGLLDGSGAMRDDMTYILHVLGQALILLEHLLLDGRELRRREERVRGRRVHCCGYIESGDSMDVGWEGVFNC